VLSTELDTKLPNGVDKLRSMAIMIITTTTHPYCLIVSLSINTHPPFYNIEVFQNKDTKINMMKKAKKQTKMNKNSSIPTTTHIQHQLPL
jgi:hypothetical protein